MLEIMKIGSTFQIYVIDGVSPTMEVVSHFLFSWATTCYSNNTVSPLAGIGDHGNYRELISLKVRKILHIQSADQAIYFCLSLIIEKKTRTFRPS